MYFWIFLRFFCRLIYDQNKRCQGFVSVIRENGCMLPLSWCAKNNNLTLFWCQTRWLLFSLFWNTLYIKIFKFSYYYAPFCILFVFKGPMASMLCQICQWVKIYKIIWQPHLDLSCSTTPSHPSILQHHLGMEFPIIT